MNTRLSLLTAALLLTGASSVFAASSTELTVTGLITPVACTPSLPSDGLVDLGKISAKDLFQDKETPLPDSRLQLSVKCDASAVFRIARH
jgi:type 1 fimbria pilin